MAHGFIIESMIQAKNIDALNRSVTSAVDVDGGGLVALLLILQLRVMTYGQHQPLQQSLVDFGLLTIPKLSILM